MRDMKRKWMKTQMLKEFTVQEMTANTELYLWKKRKQ